MRALILNWFLHSTKFIHSTKMCHSPCSFQFWNSFCLEIIIYQADTFKPLRQISLRFTKLLFLLAQDQNLLALGNRVISLPAFVGGMFKSGHVNTPPNTRPVLHHASVLGTLSRHSWATTRLDRKLGQNSPPKTVPQCNSTQLWPSLTRNLKILQFRNSSRENGLKL